MRRNPLLLLGASWLFSHETMSQSLPYNPTTILLSPKDPNLAYVFLPSTSSSSPNQLAYLNISTTIQASNLSLSILTDDLPFSRGSNAGESIAYIPSISTSGSIGVYAGSCTSKSSFWIYYPSYNQSSQKLDNGTWREMSATPLSSITTGSLPNANFLASSFSFSTLVNSNDTQRTVYNFGGLCPTGTTSNASTWQLLAIYSNNMLRLAYSTPTSYDLSLSSGTSNKPIAEAGFTVTALQPTFSNSTGVVTQAQSYVLLGGHTNGAFINMSQVALFSLPQETWSFQNIDSAVRSGGTELAMKSTTTTAMTTPDSRSGHSAVLSSDGGSIYVFGGWVGDINTPAEPQLAILHPGGGFGGSGNWIWELPNVKGTSLAIGSGIYGHGAVMLPGNIMMIVGGNHITVPNSSKSSKRSNSGVEAFFLNTTSMTWVSNYTNPSYIPFSPTIPGSSSAPDAGSTSKKVGLGVGLGLGLAALTGVLIFYFWYSRRIKRRRRDAREKDLQQLSQNAALFYSTHGGNPGINQGGREGWWARSQNGEMTQRVGMTPFSSANTSLGNTVMAVGAGGNSGYVPVVYPLTDAYGDFDDNNLRPYMGRLNTRGGSITRKPVNPRNTRGYYQPTPSSGLAQQYSGFDFGMGHSRANSLGTAGVIHPIYEADEDLDASNAQNKTLDTNSKSDVGDAIGDQDGDPFLDPQGLSPTRSTHLIPESRPGTGSDQYRDHGTPTPELSAQEREREVREWVADWAAADALLQSRAQSMTYSGRISPSKESASGRTQSNLSERSIATVSALTLSRNGSTRNNSLTAFFTNGPSSWNPFTTTGAASAALGSITEYRNGEVSPVSENSSEQGHLHGSKPPASAGSGTSSFTTAQTSQSFSTLRAEAENLLLRPEEYVSEGSPSKIKAAAFTRRQQGGWLGSIKRVFVGLEEDGSSNGSARSSPTRGHRSDSMSNSPTRMEHDILSRAGPRRSVSATATMWRRKQGKDDWEDSAEPQAERSNTLTLDGSWHPILDDQPVHRPPGADDEEWDIERAVERRVVQVMFTVPKERLRVVNHDIKIEEDESEAGSLKEPEVLLKPEHEHADARINAHGDILEEERVPTSRPGSPGKGKGKVQEIVEQLERRNTPPVD